MVFSSYEMIFLFLPIVLIGYYALSQIEQSIFQKLFLVGASLFFYAYFNPVYLIIILSSIIINYLISKVIVRLDKVFLYKKIVLAVGILFNIGLLGYFKYLQKKPPSS